MFSVQVETFIRESMCIKLESIKTILEDPILLPDKPLIVKTIEYFCEVLIEFEPERQPFEFDYYSSNEAEDAINDYANTITDSLDEESLTYQVIDALRHAFSSYACNGLLQLYTRQENEAWYPKVVLNNVLEPNDISSLPSQITLFRGCDISEYETGCFGQSWSTSEEIASLFAYSHYAEQDWYDQSNRVVLKCVCARSDVFFSDQSVEYEVVVNPEKINNVKIYTHNNQ